MLTMFWPGNVIGRPEMSSCSFANAISEPENEIEPISAERTIDDELVVATPPARDVELGQRDERRRAAADPVEQGHHLRHRGHLHRAGADERRRRADRAPRRRSGPSCRSRRAASVVTIATTCRRRRPSCPCRACFGEERKRSATMKQMIATR